MEPVAPVSVEPVNVIPADPIEPAEPQSPIEPQEPTILPIDPPPIVIIPTPPREPKLIITTVNTGTMLHDVDLGALGFSIRALQEDIVELSQDDVRQYFRENGTLEEWMKKTQKERTDIQIKGHKIHKIARLFLVNEDPVNIREIWHILLGKIFELRIEKFTQENVRQYFRENGTLDSWKRKSGVDRGKIYIQGYGLTKVAGIFGVTGLPINNKDIWYTLLGKIFEEEIEVKKLTQTDVKKYFRDNGTLEEWKRKTTGERGKIYIQGQGLTKVGTIFELDRNPIGRLDTWYDLLGKIFEVTIEEFTQENVRQYFRENGTLDVWKRMPRRERAKIKIKGYSITKISTMFGINGSPLDGIDAWHALLDAIFSEETQQ